MGSGAYEQKYQLRKQRLEFREHNCDIKEGSMRFQQTGKSYRRPAERDSKSPIRLGDEVLKFKHGVAQGENSH